MTTDDGLKGLIDFLTRYNKWRRRNDDDDSEFIEMPLPRDIGIAIDEAIGHLTKLAANVHDSGDVSYEVWQDGMCVAGASGDGALDEAHHYATMPMKLGAV